MAGSASVDDGVLQLEERVVVVHIRVTPWSFAVPLTMLVTVDVSGAMLNIDFDQATLWVESVRRVSDCPSVDETSLLTLGGPGRPEHRRR